MKNIILKYYRENLTLWIVFFVIWSIGVAYSFTGSQIETHIELNSYHTPFLDTFFKYITDFGGNLPFILIGIFILFNLRDGFFLLLGQGICSLITQIFKHTCCHPRPLTLFNSMGIDLPPTVEGVHIWDAMNSFPSGHTQVSTSLFVSIAIWIKKRWMWVLAITMAILVAFSRLYLGVHFPTDVIAGFALGIALSFVCCYLHNKVENKLKLYGITVIIASAGLFFCTTEDFFTGYGILVGALGAFLFEEKFVNFSLDVSLWKKAIRVVFGIIIILGLKEGLKIPFDLIAEGNLYLRALRYAIASFCALGLYPMLFKKFNF